MHASMFILIASSSGGLQPWPGRITICFLGMKVPLEFPLPSWLTVLNHSFPYHVSSCSSSSRSPYRKWWFSFNLSSKNFDHREYLLTTCVGGVLALKTPTISQPPPKTSWHDRTWLTHALSLHPLLGKFCIYLTELYVYASGYPPPKNPNLWHDIQF
jgi:hypothetical protein